MTAQPGASETRHWVRRAVVLIIVGILVLASWLWWSGTSKNTQAVARPTVERHTAAVVSTSMERTTTLTANLTYGATTALPLKASGVVTKVIEVGARIGPGVIIARVNDEAIVALEGEMPAYRALALGTKGRDVRQFKRALRGLGYGGFRVNDTFDQPVVDAVIRWQQRLGNAPTGQVDPTKIMYLAQDLRVSAILIAVGGSAPGDLYRVTSTQRRIIGRVAKASATWAKQGAAVRLVFSRSQQSRQGVVEAIADVPTTSSDTPADSTSGGDGPQVDLTVRSDDTADPGEAGDPVTVTHVIEQRTHVLAVPVTALLALAGGGYGVEVVDPSGGVRVVPVRTGLITDGRVEVTGGGLAAGQRVVVTP